VTRGSVASLAEVFGAMQEEGRIRGEFTLVLAPIGEEVSQYNRMDVWLNYIDR